MEEQLRDWSIYGVHITKDGKRIDPKDFFMTPTNEQVELKPEEEIYQDIVNHPDIMRIMQDFQAVKLSRRKAAVMIAFVIKKMGYRRPQPDGKLEEGLSKEQKLKIMALHKRHS